MVALTEESRLRALAALNILDTPREERFDRLVRLAQRMFDVPMAMVSLIDQDRQWNKAEVGLGHRDDVPRSASMCDHTIRGDEALVVTDPVHDPRFASYPGVAAEGGVRFYAGQPLHAPGGARVGSLCIVDTRARTLDDNQLAILRELADFVETELARTDELDRAGELQRTLLPRRTPHLPGYDVAGVCLPASAVGGDFFDWHALGDDFQVVIADVMGKGIPAAIIGASVRSVLRGASRFNDVEVAVNRAAAALESDLFETSTFVTLLAARLDPSSGTLTYVDAGHGIAGIVTPRRHRPPVRVRRPAPGRPRLGALAGRPGGARARRHLHRAQRRPARPLRHHRGGPRGRPRHRRVLLDRAGGRRRGRRLRPRPPRHRRRHRRGGPPPRRRLTSCPAPHPHRTRTARTSRGAAWRSRRPTASGASPCSGSKAGSPWSRPPG